LVVKNAGCEATQVASDASNSYIRYTDLQANVDTHALGTNLMTYIALLAVIGILLLQLSGAVPLASVGGSMIIGWAFLTAALAVGIHEAWTQKRGVLGWIVNIVVSFAGAFVAAPLGGMVVVPMLSDGSRSLAAAGGPRFSVALAGMMLVTLLGSWGALWIVNRWR
jgi:hypothetical protein